ncbi:PadR family transcriptional regulator [Oceanirhabdus sp. W0125-5]|uniref:PadR family transcriptional regulator n=1 Tax=Oceanirhabdus sp. W0125-5 TaxID=2999116 RepID=UPI0022F2BBCE|nr:PadR family transcriptional regulator [Oceanirhabdus sp. W0125-5]WBW97639.1 PadR family transcriptional regulator [Oceanirhabdus sp. W0125-5]
MEDKKVYKKYLPMTESTYYILLSLTEERHGYSIMQHVDKITNSRLKLGPGTLYGVLSKMEKESVIKITREEDKRKYYILNDLGKKLLFLEIERLKELYTNGIQYGGENYGCK